MSKTAENLFLMGLVRCRACFTLRTKHNPKISIVIYPVHFQTFLVLYDLRSSTSMSLLIHPAHVCIRSSFPSHRTWEFVCHCYMQSTPYTESTEPKSVTTSILSRHIYKKQIQYEYLVIIEG